MPGDGRRAVLVQLEPHHLGLGAGAEVEARGLLELGLVALEVPAAVGGEERRRVLALLAVAEADAPDASDLRIPRKRLERVGLGDADELGGLGAVPDVVAVAVGEEVRGRAVDELEALLRDRLPVLRRNALAHDAAGDGGELVVDVRDPLGVDAPSDVLYEICASVRSDEAFQVRRHLTPPFRPALSCVSLIQRLALRPMSEPRSEHLTAEQRAALEAELAELEGPRRKAAIQAIKTAREFGDLSENFEYHAAKNEQGLLEARIRTSA